jgi:hypothetical protein
MEADIPALWPLTGQAFHGFFLLFGQPVKRIELIGRGAVIGGIASAATHDSHGIPPERVISADQAWSACSNGWRLGRALK